MKRLSFEEAKRLSIKKWQKHVNCNGFDIYIETDKELSKLVCNCGFCERHHSLDGDSCFLQCDDCEFGKVAGRCIDVRSLYDEWYLNKTRINAEKILDVIKNLEEQ